MKLVQCSNLVVRNTNLHTASWTVIFTFNLRHLESARTAHLGNKISDMVRFGSVLRFRGKKRSAVAGRGDKELFGTAASIGVFRRVDAHWPWTEPAGEGGR
jgi:hypothetical protein